MSDNYSCGVQTSRMKGPCELWKHHGSATYKGAHVHRSRRPVSETSPRLTQFAAIVNEGLDRGITYSYAEIGEMMGGLSTSSVRNYGLGARYTRLRQKIYRERGIEGNKRRTLKTPQQKLVQELKRSGNW